MQLCFVWTQFGLVLWQLQVDLKQFEGMAVATARKNKEEEEDALDLKNKRGPKTLKEKPLKEVAIALLPSLPISVLFT